MRAELDAIRTRGVATEREECRIGFLSVAAPVFGSHGILTGAISVTAPTSRTTIERLTPSVRAAASAISRRLRSVVEHPER